mgnify:CR=1 FL=1
MQEKKMSDGSRSTPEERRGRREEKVLDSETLAIRSKRFYVDVKENNRGRFIKIAEVSLDGRRNRLTMSMTVAASFLEHLGKFIKFYDELAPGEENGSEKNSQLMSETIMCNPRRYYMDLKENRRGRYLRVSQTLILNMYGNMRPQIALPAQGMVQLRDVLNTFVEKYGKGYINERDIGEPKMIRSENNRKIFYFDVNHNDRGTFVRVSEVKQLSGFRSSIAVPLESWASFRDTFNELLKEVEKPKEEAVVNGTMEERGE